MNLTTKENKNFAAWAAQIYATKKEAVDFLENSTDPFDHAIGTLIKKYAGVSKTRYKSVSAKVARPPRHKTGQTLSNDVSSNIINVAMSDLDFLDLVYADRIKVQPQYLINHNKSRDPQPDGELT